MNNERGMNYQNLKEICLKIGSGATPKGGKDVYLPYRKKFVLVRSQNVFDRFFDITGLANIRDRDAELLNQVILQENDILLNITGDGITFGRACIIPKKILPAVLNQHVSIIRVNPNLCSPGYLLSVLTHPEFKTYIESFNSGGSRRAITKGHIESFEIPLPPLPTQKAIAHILGTLDGKIELNRRMNETLESIARAIFKSWFIDFDPVRAKAEGRQPEGMDAETAALFPSEFETVEGQEIPKGWQVKPIQYVCNVRRGSSPRPIQEYMDGNIPWIKIADVTSSPSPFLFITKEKIIESGIRNSVEVYPGDLILSNSATCGVPIFVNIYGCIHDGWLLFRDFTSISKNYLFHALSHISDELIRIADGSVQKNLNTDLINNQLLIIPPTKILESFDKTNDLLFEKIKSLSEENISLEKIRDTLLPKLLSGEITIENPEQFTGVS